MADQAADTYSYFFFFGGGGSKPANLLRPEKKYEKLNKVDIFLVYKEYTFCNVGNLVSNRFSRRNYPIPMEFGVRKIILKFGV